MHAEPAEDAADQRFGGCVKRGGMDDDIAGLDQCKQGGGDRRHARREGEGVLRLFPKAQPVLQYLLIGAVEAGIDKAFRRSPQIGSASCRERGWQYVEISVVAVSLKKKKKQ